MKAITTTLALTLFACLPAHGANEKLRIDELGKVGVGTATPSTKLEVNGALTIGDVGETEAPKAGTIKFDGQDFLGYDGSSWRSLTLGASSGSGGSGSDSPSGTLLALPAGDPAPAGYTFLHAIDEPLKWEQVASRNFANTAGELEAIDGKLYYVGGGFEGDPTPETRRLSPERYDPATDQWTVITLPDDPRSDPAITSHGGKLYLFGGDIYWGEGQLNEFYDPGTNKWGLAPSFPDQYYEEVEGRRLNLAWVSSATSLDNKIYLSVRVEGKQGHELLVLNVDSGTWDTKKWIDPNVVEGWDPDITPGGPLLTYQGKVFVFQSKMFSIFDPATNEWKYGPYVWDEDKESYCHWSHGGRIFSGHLGYILSYDPRTGVTQRYATGIEEEDDFGNSSAAVLGDYVYVLGSAGDRQAKSFYRASLTGLRDLYVKD